MVLSFHYVCLRDQNQTRLCGKCLYPSCWPTYNLKHSVKRERHHATGSHGGFFSLLGESEWGKKRLSLRLEFVKKRLWCRFSAQGLREGKVLWKKVRPIQKLVPTSQRRVCLPLSSLWSLYRECWWVWNYCFQTVSKEPKQDGRVVLSRAQQDFNWRGLDGAVLESGVSLL